MEEEKEVVAGRKRVEKRKHLLDSSSDEKASIKKAKRSGGKRKRPDPGEKTSDIQGMDPAEYEDIITQGRGPKKRRTRDCSEDEKKPSMKTDVQKNKDLQEDPGGSGCSGVRPTGSSTISSSIKERLLFHQVLGQGSFGTVMMAEDTVTHHQYAVKMIRKSSLLTENVAEYMLVEKRVLQLASESPFLVHAAFALQTKMHVLLGLQYESCGDFLQLLLTKGPFTINHARFYAAELVCGIQFLHAKGVIHRDLKPENILVADTGHIKITDFGLALDNMHGDRTATSYAGTMGYMAPEMLARKKYNAGVDWYSFGIIINEMLTSEIDYDPSFFPRSSSVKNIIEQLLQKHPAKRLGVHGNIRGHPFFRRIDWVSVEALKPTPPFNPDPNNITPSFRPFKIDKIEAAEAKSSITPAAQDMFRGFSFVNWETLNRTPAQ
ncbi:protein kinase C delta type-like [Dendropsophus ebraccatus]|uniref:protein kinase C delta type-like n=1 Tax=Dendropsophus ebraccatus TaxID=150705 RepID=UPI003831D056